MGALKDAAEPGTHRLAANLRRVRSELGRVNAGRADECDHRGGEKETCGDPFPSEDRAHLSAPINAIEPASTCCSDSPSVGENTSTWNAASGNEK